MKLRAEIVIELQAADFIEAAELQRQMETLQEEIQGRYPNAVLNLRERRDRKVSRLILDPAPVEHQTGRAHDYID